MINLIPTEEKKKMRTLFFFRLISTVFFMFGISFLVASIALIPAYLISSGKKNLVEDKLQKQKDQVMPEVDKKAQMAIDDLNNQLAIVEKSMSGKYVFSEKIITEILSQKTSGIKIEKIFYENDQTEGKKVKISGIASNRGRLLLFRRAFESIGIFKKVDLPISNFVKGNNIEFDLNLIAE